MTKISTFFLLCITFSIYAQHTIITPGNQGANVVASTTNNGGIELPRLSNSQIQAIANPKAGTIVYDSDVNALRYFNGNRWALTNEQSFSQQISGYYTDEGNDICFDKSGNMYVTGTFYGTININGVNLTAAGSSDVFIAKFSNSGNLLWAVKGGGANEDHPEAISVTERGRVTIIGHFETSTTFGYYNANSNGSFDVFVVQYSADGSLYWATSFGSTMDDRAQDIVNDANGNTYVTGSFNGTMNFYSNIPVPPITSTGASDIFYAKLDNSGYVIWANRFGGASYDYSRAIIADTNGNTYLTGSFKGVASQGSISLTGLNNEDFVFVAKIGTDGNINWAKKGGGANAYTYGRDLVLDNNNNVIVTGEFTGGVTFENTSLSGASVMFWVKYNNNGVFQSINTFGNSLGTGSTYPMAIAKDNKGNLFIGGWYGGSVEVDNKTYTSNGTDIFVMKINSAGNPTFFQGVGGAGTQLLKGMAVKKDGTTFITGSFDNELIFGDINFATSTPDDCFILKVF